MSARRFTVTLHRDFVHERYRPVLKLEDDEDGRRFWEVGILAPLGIAYADLREGDEVEVSARLVSRVVEVRVPHPASAKEDKGGTA